MKTLWVLGLAMSILSNSAQAAVVGACGSLNDLGYISEPWEKNTKTFLKGKVRIVRINTNGEPTCCSNHLAVLVPSEEGVTSCYIFSGDKIEGSENSYKGYQSLQFNKITARYKRETGSLVITIPYIQFIDDMAVSKGKSKVSVNLQDGSLKIEE